MSRDLDRNLGLTKAELLDLRVFAIQCELDFIHFLNHVWTEMPEETETFQKPEAWMPGPDHQFHLSRKIMEFVLNGQCEPGLE